MSASAPASAPPTHDLGILLSAGAGGDRPLDQLPAVCAALEDTGCGALWFTDHLFWGQPCPDPFVAAAVATVATQRCTVGTAVAQVPLRHVPSVAKAASSLAELGGGRFILGVGIGEHAGEYHRAGRTFAGRGAQLDADIEHLRQLWAEPTEVDGWYQQLPTPGPLPVWVGGHSTAARQRAATLADGWFPAFVTPDHYQRDLEDLRARVEQAGRPASAVVAAVAATVAVTGPGWSRSDALGWLAATYGLAPEAFERHLVTGPPAAIEEHVARYREAGADHVALFPASHDLVASVDRLGLAG